MSQRDRAPVAMSALGPEAARVRDRALALGFHAVGFAAATTPLGVDFERFQQFLRRGMHGQMAYLAEHEAVRERVDGPEILAGAATVICVARRYHRAQEDESTDPAVARLIARYARGRDYHSLLKKRLRQLADFVCSLAPGVRARSLCDTAPLLERAWAVRAGLGFVGKNGLLIVPGQGSYVLLGEVVTSKQLELPASPPVAEQCGPCQLCVDACPTGALVAPFVLDPRRCIAYATIEARADPPPEVAVALDERLFGCDRCQEVCPHNDVEAPPRQDTEPFRPAARWRDLALADLLALDDEAWRELARGTALRRLSHRQLVRNVLFLAAARWRRGDEAARRVLERAKGHRTDCIRELAERVWPEGR